MQIHPSTLTAETLSELRFLAALLDTLLCSKLLSLGDLITRRLKAAQIKIRDGDTALASQIDLTAAHAGTLATPEEEYHAVRRQLLTARLASYVRTHRLMKSGRCGERERSKRDGGANQGIVYIIPFEEKEKRHQRTRKRKKERKGKLQG